MTPEPEPRWLLSVSDGGVKHDKEYRTMNDAFRAFNEAMELKCNRITLYQHGVKVLEWRDE